jgi:hypothetical protein
MQNHFHSLSPMRYNEVDSVLFDMDTKECRFP